MTNFEYWEERILEIAETNACIGLVNGILQACGSEVCGVCEFAGECNKKSTKWLYAKCTKKPKLKKKERKFCKKVKTGWIVREKSGMLFWYSQKPYQIIIGGWCKHDRMGRYERIDQRYGKNLFEFIEWEDPEPWSVEELLKLDTKGKNK